MMSSSAKWCVANLRDWSRPDCTAFSNIGVVVVSTSRVVIEILRSHNLSS
jgi:hypothetical protein